MALPIWQRTITTASGDLVPNAEITVVNEATGLGATIFSNREGTTPLGTGGVFFTGSDGFAQFYAAPGEYRVTAAGVSGSQTWRWIALVGDAALRDADTEATPNTVVLRDANGTFKIIHLSMTGSITLNGTTNNTVVMTDIVTDLDLEIGDVIRIDTGAYNKLHTVESITDNSSIIVNYEHAGNRRNGSLRLPDFAGQATVTRIAKWFNAPEGLGVNWVQVARTPSTTYAYLDGRRSLGLIYTGAGTAGSRSFTITSGGVSIYQGSSNSSGDVGGSWAGSVTGEWSFATTYTSNLNYYERR